MRRLGGLVLVLAVSAAVAVPSASGLTLDPGRYGLTQIGRFHPLSGETLADAVRDFGRPSSRHGFSGCGIQWSRYKLKIVFANFGGGVQRCRSAQVLKRADSHRWQTNRHLRVGQSLARLHHLYPGAKRHGASFWLRTAVSPFGTGARYAVLAARTHHGHVTGFKGWIGAAGE